MFKDLLTEYLGYETATKWRMSLFCISSAMAEIIADIFLCPFEAIKLRMQTSDFGKFPLKMRPAIAVLS